MNPTTFLPVTIELLVKSALVSLAAALLARGWREATAAQRHLVWLVALATVMLLPLTHLIAPQWTIPLQPAKKVTVTLPALPPVHVTNRDAIPFAEPIPAARAVRTLPDWRIIVLGVWLSGTVFLLGYRLFGSWRLHRLKRRSIPLDDSRVRLLLSRVLSELGLPRRPEVRLSQECRVPITWGSLRPVMLLPAAALAWNDTWLTAALRHEAAHIRRYDYLTRWFAHVACALYWPNPLVWLLARSLRVAQELAADDLVLRAGTPPEEYATQLVDAARNVVLQGFFVRQAVAMACPSTLEDRIRAIVDGRRDRRPLSRLAAAGGSVAIALALGLNTAAQLRSDEQKPTLAPAADAPPAATAPTRRVPRGPQIEIESKFIEIETAPGKVPPPAPEEPAIYSDPQFQVIIRALNQKKGVDLLAAPRVTTVDNQGATVEVVREIRYPTAWEKDGKKWKSTDSETKKCGVILEVTPRITPDGAIELHSVATMVEFKGFVDLDNGGATPGKKKNGTTVESEFPPVPAGHRTKPVFSEHKSDKTVTLESGQTVEFFVREATRLQHVVDGKSAWDDVYRCQTFLFISPRIVNPAPAKEAPKEGAAGTSPAPADSEAVLTVDKSGSVKLNGEPTSIDDLKARLQALEARVPGFSVVVRGDEKVPYKVVAELLERVREAGIAKARLAPPTGKAGAVATTPPTFLLNDSGTIDIPAESPTKRADGLLTKEWKVPPGMIPAKAGTDGPDRVSAKGWLISKGATFGGNAAAVYVLDTSRLIVRNTQEQLNLVDQIISANVADPGPAPAKETSKPGAAAVDAPADSPARRKAEKIILSDFELRSASVETALDVLRKLALENDPEKTGVKLVLQPGTVSEAEITVSLHTIPLIEAMKYVAGLANLELAITPDALILRPLAADPAAPKPGADASPYTGRTVVSGVQDAPPDSPVLNKAEKIIIPKIEFREATLPEILDFLRKQAVVLDPDKAGLDIVLKPGAAREVRITMSLVNVPLLEALRYAAELAGLALQIQPHGFVLAPREKVGKVDVTADHASFDSTRGEAVFEGHVQIGPANQPANKLAADKLVLSFPNQAAVPVPQVEPAPAAGNAPAPNTDAGDLFVNAYLTVKKSEQLEAAGRIPEALEQMKIAVQKLEEVSKQFPAWQPDIVNYRKERSAEALERLKGKL